MRRNVLNVFAHLLWRKSNVLLYFGKEFAEMKLYILGTIIQTGLVNLELKTC